MEVKSTQPVKVPETNPNKGMSLSTKKFLAKMIRDAADGYLQMLEEQEPSVPVKAGDGK